MVTGLKPILSESWCSIEPARSSLHLYCELLSSFVLRAFMTPLLCAHQERTAVMFATEEPMLMYPNVSMWFVDTQPSLRWGVQKRERLASRGDCPLIHQRTMACQYIPAFQNKLRQYDSNSNDSKFWLCGLTNMDRYRCKSVWGCPGVPTHPHWPGGTPRLTWFPAAAPVPATTPACVVWATFAL